MLPVHPRISAAAADALKSKEPPFNAVCRVQLSCTEGPEQPGIHLNKVTPFDF